MSNRAAVWLGIGCLAAVGLAAEQRPPAVPDQRPPVTFTTEINYVEIDAIVTDSAGRFVPGLTKDDFRISEEGKPHPITAFSLVHIPVDRAGEAARPLDVVEPDTVTNRQAFDGRIFVLLLDDLQTDLLRSQFVRTAARDFVERHVTANDLVAVAFTSGGSGQDFTASRRRLLAAADRFRGVKQASATRAGILNTELATHIMRTAAPGPPVADLDAPVRQQQSDLTAAALRHQSEFLAGIRGRRKALVYFGEGLAEEPGHDPGLNPATREAVAALTRANVNVYIIDPRGLSTGQEDAITLPTLTMDPTSKVSTNQLTKELRDSHRMLRYVADETGGMAFLNTNDTAGPFARIVEDNSSYYLLGYYAPAGRRDGRFRKVDVRVSRPGLTVRARRGYYAPGPERSAASTKPPVTKTSGQLQEALRSPLPVNGLVFSASAAAFQGTAPGASVTLVVEVDPAGLAFTERGTFRDTDIELHVTATDPLSKTPASSTHHLAELRLRPQTYEAVKAEGVRITRRLELRPGRYRLQLGVRDNTSGAVGTLFTDVDVPKLFDPALAMSGIVLVSAAATRMPTVEPDPALSLLLPGAHTARRDFPVNDTLAVFAEIYDNDLTRPHPVRVATTVRDAQGREVFSASAEQGSEELTGTPGGANNRSRFGHHVTIPAAQLGPGRYLLRVEAARPDAAAAPVTRELEFRIHEHGLDR